MRRARFSALVGLAPNSLKIWMKAFSQLASISGQRALKAVLPSSLRSSSSSREGWSARFAPEGINELEPHLGVDGSTQGMKDVDHACRVHDLCVSLGHAEEGPGIVDKVNDLSGAELLRA